MMAATQPFQLEPISPADRAAKAAALRQQIREANRRQREAARLAGEKRVTVSLHADLIKQIDALAKRKGHRNRSQTLALILSTLDAHPDITEELGL